MLTEAHAGAHYMDVDAAGLRYVDFATDASPSATTSTVRRVS